MSHPYPFKWNQPPTPAHPFTRPLSKAQLHSKVSHLRSQLADPYLASPLSSDSFA